MAASTSTHPPLRVRNRGSQWMQTDSAADATRQAIRQSMSRFYPARGKGPRSRAAKARARALRTISY